VARLNALLLVLAIACALGVITSQHKARKLFAELDAGQSAVKKLDEEWTQLQLEQGTWATHKRVEEVASRQLGMRFADPASTVVIDAAGVPAGAPPGERR
jgi:cell division protein FtsL